MQAFLNGVDPLTTVPADRGSGNARVNAEQWQTGWRSPSGWSPQMRTEYGIDHATAVQAIVGQAENGDTLLTCDGVAGNLALDGTLAAPQGNNCAFTAAAAHFAPNPLNSIGRHERSPPSRPLWLRPRSTRPLHPDSCGDRVSLLQR